MMQFRKNRSAEFFRQKRDEKHLSKLEVTTKTGISLEDYELLEDDNYLDRDSNQFISISLKVLRALKISDDEYSEYVLGHPKKTKIHEEWPIINGFIDYYNWKNNSNYKLLTGKHEAPDIKLINSNGDKVGIERKDITNKTTSDVKEWIQSAIIEKDGRKYFRNLPANNKRILLIDLEHAPYVFSWEEVVEITNNNAFNFPTNTIDECYVSKYVPPTGYEYLLISKSIDSGAQTPIL
jgi:hypothetical protein